MIRLREKGFGHARSGNATRDGTAPVETPSLAVPSSLLLGSTETARGWSGTSKTRTSCGVYTQSLIVTSPEIVVIVTSRGN